MANLIFAQQVADAIIYNDEAYHYIGTTASAPNADVGDITTLNISAYTFDAADPQGKKVYSKCEHAVAYYVSANYATKLCPDANTEYTVYTAPSDGVARLETSEGSGYSKKWLVNGTVVAEGNYLGGKVNALGINLNSGDVVSVQHERAGNTANVGFLPDTY